MSDGLDLRRYYASLDVDTARVAVRRAIEKLDDQRERLRLAEERLAKLEPKPGDPS